MTKAETISKKMSNLSDKYVKDMMLIVENRDFDINVAREKGAKLTNQLRADTAEIKSQMAQLVCDSCDESSDT